MTGLDGVWRLERTGGLLPPLGALRKEIAGAHGATVAGPVRFPFRVVGSELRYRIPPGLVDVLEPDGDGYRGRALVLGREVGRFRMQRVS